jgi:Cu/Zn superoxide dismutase
MVVSLAFGAALVSACAEEPREGDELDLPERDEPSSYEGERGDRPEGNVVTTANFEPGEGAGERAISGTVTVLEGEEPTGGYRLAVEIEGLTPGEHAWHIHNAPCGKQGPVVVPFTATESEEGLAQALDAGEGGMAEAEVTVPSERLSLDELKSGEYSLHVHQNAGADHGPTVACADL